MTNEPKWWESTETRIHEIESSMDAGVFELHGREVDGSWEYALVRWWHGSSTATIFRNGKVVAR